MTLDPRLFVPAVSPGSFGWVSVVGLEASWECGLLVGYTGLLPAPWAKFFTFPRELSEGLGVAPLQCLALLVTGGPVDHPSIRQPGRLASTS